MSIAGPSLYFPKIFLNQSYNSRRDMMIMMMMMERLMVVVAAAAAAVVRKGK
jgi:hypothetical protein